MKIAYYLDTSALIKRYLQEEGSEFVLKLFKTNPIFVTSELTYAEVYSAVYRVQREGLLSLKNSKNLLNQFEEDWKSFTVISFKKEIRQEVPNLIAKFPLRGADLVHLASAVLMWSRKIENYFVASDIRLLNAAEDFGLSVINPTESKGV